MPVVDLETRSFRGLAVLQSDGELIGAVLGGDRKAFAILIKRYEPSVRAVAVSARPAPGAGRRPGGIRQGL